MTNQSKKKLHHKARRFTATTAAALAIMLLSVTAFAAGIIHIQMEKEVYDGVHEINYAKTDDAELELGHYYASYVPEGYTIGCVGVPFRDHQVVWYINGSGEKIMYSFELGGEGGQISFDNVTEEEEVTVGAVQGTLYTQKNGSRLLFWTDDAAGVGFVLQAQDPTVDLLRMAESVTRCEEVMPEKQWEE